MSELTEAMEDLIDDPYTTAFTLAVLNESIGTGAITVSNREYFQSVELCAAVLMEHGNLVDEDLTPFLKDVIQEINERDIQSVSEGSL